MEWREREKRREEKEPGRLAKAINMLLSVGTKL